MLISGLWLENLDDVFQSLVFPIVPERDYCKAEALELEANIVCASAALLILLPLPP
jgi:hypothetical protein